MDSKTKIDIEKSVRKIIEESDMTSTTESQIRKRASQELGLDLNKPEFKAYVRHVVNKFLQEASQKEQEKADAEAEEAEEADGGEGQQSGGGMEYDDDGDLIICRLTSKRRVTIQNFKGRNLVSIREFYSKDGKELPTSKGISLTDQQWAVLRKNMDAVDQAVTKMQDY
ncbi:RNA polymerase II transcriptional coactivator KELP [Linum grandiflorum]